MNPIYSQDRLTKPIIFNESIPEPRHGGFAVLLTSDQEMSEYGISELVTQVEDIYKRKVS